MFKKLQKDVKLRLLADLWAPAFLVFVFVYMLELNDTGLVFTFICMVFYDWYVMEQKGFIKNLICNFVTMCLYIILYAKLSEVYSNLTDLNPFLYGFFSAFMSYVVFDRISKFRRINTEWYNEKKRN